MLYLYWRMVYGAARNAGSRRDAGPSAREWWLLGPIAVGVFWMGIYPETFIRPIRNDVGRVMTRLERVAPGRRLAPDARQGRPMDHGASLMGRFAALLPELILSIGGIDPDDGRGFRRPARSSVVSWLAIALLLAATVALIGAPSHAGPLFDGIITADLFASFGKAVMFPAAAVAIIAAHGWFERGTEHASEYSVLIVFAAVGMA